MRNAVLSENTFNSASIKYSQCKEGLLGLRGDGCGVVTGS